jgi:competence ComEA-like helix-hairpin-helix protein
MPLPDLTKREQSVVATLVLVSLAAMAVWWVATGGSGGRIDVDRFEPLPYAFRVDVNAAGRAELSQLPEIGPVLATRIVEYRQQNGPYTSREQLLEVRGIGARTLARIEGYLLPLPDDAMVADSPRPAVPTATPDDASG